jgi:hypothetical protein
MRGAYVPYDIYISHPGTDMVRLPDGRFAVLEDNLRVPSGISYMLANRQVMKRLFPRMFRNDGARSVDRCGSALLATLGTELPDTDLGNPYAVARALTFEMENPASLVGCSTRARENARQVRDLISSPMWEQLNELYLYVHRVDTAWEWSTQPYEYFGEVREGMRILQGITDSTMQRAEGWQFIPVGRFLEWASAASSLVGLYSRSVLGPEHLWVDSDRYLDWVALLNGFAAFEAYCKVYMGTSAPSASRRSWCSTAASRTRSASPPTASRPRSTRSPRSPRPGPRPPTPTGSA